MIVDRQTEIERTRQLRAIIHRPICTFQQTLVSHFEQKKEF